MNIFERCYQLRKIQESLSVQSIASELIVCISNISACIKKEISSALNHKLDESYLVDQTVPTLEAATTTAAALLKRLHGALKDKNTHLEPKVFNEEIERLGIESDSLMLQQMLIHNSKNVTGQEKESIYRKCNTYRNVISALRTVIVGFNEKFKNNPEWIADLPEVPNFVS